MPGLSYKYYLKQDFTLKKAWRYEKKQKSVDDGGDKLSIKAIQQDGKVIVLLNEMDANSAEKDKTFHAGLAHKSSIMAIVIDADGNQTKKIIENEKPMSQDFTHVYNDVLYRLVITESGYQLARKNLPLL